jgi:hypothetical protein
MNTDPLRRRGRDAEARSQISQQSNGHLDRNDLEIADAQRTGLISLEDIRNPLDPAPIEFGNYLLNRHLGRPRGVLAFPLQLRDAGSYVRLAQ